MEADEEDEEEEEGGETVPTLRLPFAATAGGGVSPDGEPALLLEDGCLSWSFFLVADLLGVEGRASTTAGGVTAARGERDL